MLALLAKGTGPCTTAVQQSEKDAKAQVVSGGCASLWLMRPQLSHWRMSVWPRSNRPTRPTIIFTGPLPQRWQVGSCFFVVRSSMAGSSRSPIQGASLAFPLRRMSERPNHRLVRCLVKLTDRQCLASANRSRFSGPLKIEGVLPKSSAAGRPKGARAGAGGVRRTAHFHVAQRRIWP